MEFNFPKKEGTGIAKLIPHVSQDAQDLISKLLIYNSEQRISASQALKHAYFKDYRESEPEVIPQGIREGPQTVGSVGGMLKSHR